MLTVREEALRDHQMENVLCPRHRDIEQTALLLEFGGGAGTQVRRHATVDHVQHVYRLPFLAFGRMDGRQDEVVLVQQRHARLIAGRIRWIQGEFGEKAFTRRIPTSYLLELDEIGAANLGVFVDALKMRFVPEAGTFKVRRPFRIPEVSDRSDEGSPVVACAGRAGQTAKCAEGVGSLRHLVEDALRGSGTDTRQQM